MSTEKPLRERVFETCDLMAQENKSISRNRVRDLTGGSDRDVGRFITEWKEQRQKSALAVSTSAEVYQQSSESVAISDEAVPKAVPVEAVISNADIEQIKLEALERLKAKRLAVVEVARVYEENPNLVPLEIKREIEEAERAAISTPLSHRTYYDPKALVQAVIATL
jgi:hypothetical protein